MRFKEFKIDEAITPAPSAAPAPTDDSFAVKVFKAMQAADAPAASTEPASDSSSDATAGPVNTTATPSSGKAFKEPGFKEALEKTAANLGIDPNHLIAIMKQESSLDPQAVNKTSGATGLIQFMPRTAAGLGTSTSALYRMTATEQLPWVEKYFKNNGVRPGMGLGDLYVAVFYPAAMGKGDSHVISKAGNAVYNQNRGLDTNKDGVITVADVKQSVSRHA